MTVAELIALLHRAPGHLEVVVRAQDDDGSDYCGTVGTAQVEKVDGAPPGTPDFFAIDCGPEDSDDFGPEEDEEAGEELETAEELDEEEGDEGDEEEPN